VAPIVPGDTPDADGLAATTATTTAITTATGDLKVPELECVRGVAALLIALTHMRLWNPWLASLPLVNAAAVPLDLFFVLSGFLIHRNYAAHLATPREVLRFQFLRFGRIYPVHLLTLGVFVLYELAKIPAAVRWGIHDRGSAPFAHDTVTALVQQVFLVQAIGPAGRANSFNGPAWSISVEFYTYLLFGVLMFGVRRHRGVVMAAIALAATVAVAQDATFGFELLLRCIGGFFAGACISALGTRGPRPSTWQTGLSIAAFFGYLLARPYLGSDWLIVPFSAWMVATLAASAPRPGPVNRALRARPLVWLGTLSYPIYMVHMAVIWPLDQAFRHVLHRPLMSVDGVLAPRLSIGEALVAMAVVLTITLALAALIHRYVEEPWRLRSRRSTFARSPRPGPP
jgi:peptidoglycan/LPS O-acetylase OafA/YrhL